MSKFAKNNTRNRNFGPGSRHGVPGIMAPVQYKPAKPRFKVVTKAEDKAARLITPTYSSKFVPARSGGLMAAMKVDGRVVFPDSRGPQPKNDGKPWKFELVGENPKQTVFFGRIITAETTSTAVKIVIQKSGKMVCVGRGPVVATFRTKKKPTNVRFAEFRHATPTMGFEPDPDNWFYADDGYDDLHHDCGCGNYDHDSDCDDGDDGDNEYGSSSYFFHEANSMWNSLPTKPVNCHSCGFEDCRCDGTGNDWVPARTTLNVLG